VLFKVLRIKASVVHAGLSPPLAQLKPHGQLLARELFLYQNNNLLVAVVSTVAKAVVVVGTLGLGTTWRNGLSKLKQATHTLHQTESLVLANTTLLLV